MATAKRYKISCGVMALIGGATRQAVHKSGKPGAWLRSRLRLWLMPEAPKDARFRPVGFKESMRGNLVVLQRHVAAVDKTIAGQVACTGRGRRMKPVDVGHLAKVLAVPFVVGDTVGSVVSRYATRLVVQMLSCLGAPSKMRWWTIIKKLDGIVPRWLRGWTTPAAFDDYKHYAT